MKLEAFVVKKFIQASIFSLFGVLVVACVIFAKDFSDKKIQLETYLDEQAKWAAPELGLSIHKGEIESTKLMLKFIEANQRNKELTLSVVLKTGEEIGTKILDHNSFSFREIALTKEYSINWGVDKVGTLRLLATEQLSFGSLMKFPLILFLFLITSQLASFLLLYFGLRDQITKPISNFTTKLEAGDSETNVYTKIFEIKKMNDVFQSFLNSIKNANIKNIELEKKNAISDTQSRMARQIAHDIRSPLMALQVMLKSTSVSGEHRDLISGAAERIQSIADDMLNQYELHGNEKRTSSIGVKYLPLISTLNKIILEKRAELSVGGIELKCNLPNEEYFVVGVQSEVMRVISNLINNSFEALGGDRKLIEIYTTVYSEIISVGIADNGRGIPSSILSKIGTEGFSYKKEHVSTAGSGLGVFSARKTIESWGGKLIISSKENEGTVVTLTFQRTAVST